MQVGDLTVDYDRYRVLRGDEIRLTPASLIAGAARRNADRVPTHRAIPRRCGDRTPSISPSTVAGRAVRKKIEADPSKRFLIASPGRYRLVSEPGE